MQRTLRRVALVITGILLSSCCCTKAPCDQGGGAVLTCQPAAMRVPGWLELRDLSFHSDAEKGPPNEPYVRGHWVGYFFDATGEIVGQVGDPPKGRSLTRGYLELRTRTFYRQDAERTRMPPVVEGSRDDDSGGFFPAAPISWSTQ